MPTTNVSISYRPVRIGFLIKDGSIDDFRRCCEINTLLWGGIYNPIIPVGGNDFLTKQLIDLFAVDILYSLTDDPQINSLIKKYPYLENPHHISENIFYEDWHTKKQAVAYIDVLHLIRYFWNEEFKHAKDDHSNCTYVSWSDQDPLAILFTAIFGAYPQSITLKDDYQKAFKNGLRAGDVVIQDVLDSELSKRITPLNLTGSRLVNHKGFGSEDGLFIGNSRQFMDLVMFWNLRASGIETVFLPIDNFERFKLFATTFINVLDERPSRHPNFEDWIGVYFLKDDKDGYKDILKNFSPKKNFMLSHLTDVTWNSLNIKPSSPQFKPKSTLSIIEERHGKYNVVIPLPEKPFFDDRTFNQSYVVSIGLNTEFEYPGYTLRLPYLPDLNEFYSRQVVFDPWTLRVGNNEIGLIEDSNCESVTLYPIAIADVMIKVFERAGFKVDISPAGRLADLIITNMEGIEGCRVFKVRGARRLIKEASNGLDWVEAEKLIWREDFKRFFDLYIESRKKKNLSPSDVLYYLIRKKVFSVEPEWKYKIYSQLQCKQKEFSCNNCGYKSNILVTQFQYVWKCGFCGAEHYLPLYVRSNLRNDLRSWRIKKSGLFAKDNNQEGSIPVILTLMQLNRRLGHGHEAKWTTSLILNSTQSSCEIDFSILSLGSRFGEQELQIAIGECKENSEINDRDVENLCCIKDKLDASGIECFLVFSKATDSFLPSEIARFKRLVKEKSIYPILFTNTELEPYEPYWHHPKENTLPHKHAMSFQEIAENSRHIYLS
jgi:hypothetical protein